MMVASDYGSDLDQTSDIGRWRTKDWDGTGDIQKVGYRRHLGDAWPIALAFGVQVATVSGQETFWS